MLINKDLESEGRGGGGGCEEIGWCSMTLSAKVAVKGIADYFFIVRFNLKTADKQWTTPLDCD